MGKKKPGKGAAAKAAPKCTCDHPFKCSCGNRPERPSRGHKWDAETQQWGGKGHKQKGASGQTALIAKESTVTDVGKTKIEQWQRLPCKLLEEACQREGRPRPKFKSIGKDRSKNLYRVILQDAKAAKRGTDHDIILVPNTGVENEEQAKQEAALLGLLHLTPSLPHERKLPEPYKSTWIHAVEAAKQSKKDQLKKKPASSSSQQQQTSTGPSTKTAAARASTNLTTATSYASKADKRKQQQEKQKERNDRIRKHEAVRMANRDHAVFLSASCRKHIETLLRDGGGADLRQMLAAEESKQEEDEADSDEDDMLKTYVLERLHNEGFTRAQAKTSYAQLPASTTENLHEDAWDKIYDECLQWLCIHLDEDQLPEGFDPRGRTLDVVVAPGTSGNISKNDASDGKAMEGKDKVAISEMTTKYGLTAKEALLVSKKASTETRSTTLLLWSLFCSVAEKDLSTNNATGLSNEEKMEMVQEELETLEAIFSPEECSVTKNNGKTTVRIQIQANDEGGSSPMELAIVMEDKAYPDAYPESVILTGGWSGPLKDLGTAVHVELIKFLSDLPSGEGMIYQIHGEAQQLLHAASDGDVPSASLLNVLGHPTKKKSTRPNSMTESTKGKGSHNKSKSRQPASYSRRPRERSFFWSVKPRDTPPAIPYPKIGPSIANARRSLPAAKARDDFLSKLKNADGRVVLVTGETGCGKTTQIPQFILEDAPLESRIVVAQPRRLAATGVAQRVANERGESQAGDGSVGYVVRGDVAMSKSTRLMFCTTGVLLRQLQSEGALEAITHIIVDEVHERHLDTDVLLGVLKECLKTTKHLRVILMSATLDADRFAAYWGKNTPRMHIPGRTFPVKDFTLEDVLSLTGYIPPKKGKKKKFNNGYRTERKATAWDDSEKSDREDDEEEETDEASKATSTTSSQKTNPQTSNIPPVEELVKRVDETNVDYDLLGILVRNLISGKSSDGSILVFLSGAPEINRALETIKKITRGSSIQLLPLHGGLQPKDQNLVFKPAQKGCTKVILSTNVAETSITIPDCTIVIDTCREKQSSYDPSNRMPLLLERFASRDSLKQRRGRAGRVQAGTCYKLISKSTLSKLPEHGEPEIKRCALEQTLLSLLFLGVESGSGNFLNTLLDPPSAQSVQAAIFSLTKIGAINENDDGTISLSPLGIHLAGIPAPPTVGKILVISCILGCRTAGLSMAAGMSLGRSPFLRINTNQYRGRRNNGDDDDDEKNAIQEMTNQKIIQERNALFKKVGSSDHAFLAACFLEWTSETGASCRKRYCDKLGLNIQGMREMNQLVRQLDSSLSSIGFFASKEADRNNRFWTIIRASAVASLAPAQIVRVQRPSTKYAETVEGAVEKDGVAREFKFYARGGQDSELAHGKSNDGDSRYKGYHGIPEERCFLHPSSALFAVGNYSCPWLVYFEMVRTSKSFLRDATECSSYALLLFGGKIEVLAAKGTIVIDDYVRLAANARIGALIGGLRRKVDDLLNKKVMDPSLDIAASVEMRLIVNLLVTDGLGK